LIEQTEQAGQDQPTAQVPRQSPQDAQERVLEAGRLLVALLTIQG
jgi:hypothetical protein